LSIDAVERPVLLVWYHEGLPDPDWPHQCVVPFARIRSKLGALVSSAPCVSLPGFATSMIRHMSHRMARLQYYGDVLWLQSMGMLDVFAVTSDWASTTLHRNRLPAVTIHFGAPTEWGDDLHLERDIPVLWIGNIATRRRRERLIKVRDALAHRGISVTMVDGNEHPYVYGSARTQLLNRAKITLNFTRAAWDNNTQRHMLAIMNRVLVISEPMPEHIPLRAGVHFVAALTDDMAEAVEYYLTHSEERAAIVERALDFVQRHMPFQASVDCMVALASAALERRMMASSGARECVL
jgi:hypothetical protein